MKVILCSKLEQFIRCLLTQTQNELQKKMVENNDVHENVTSIRIERKQKSESNKQTGKTKIVILIRNYCFAFFVRSRFFLSFF